MVMLASAAGSILSNCYYLYNPTDSWNLFKRADHPASQREAVECLMFGILKATAAFSIYSALYVAQTRLERWELKGIAFASAFCVYPLATIDFQLIRGLYEVYTALFVMHAKNEQEMDKIHGKIIEQVKGEGYRFYNFWERSLYGKSCPPETLKRWGDLTEIVGKTPEVRQVVQRMKPLILQSGELYNQGFNKFCVSLAIEIVVNNLTTRLPQLFWLDRKMVDFSRCLATRLV